jgi:hypothetical protein
MLPTMVAPTRTRTKGPKVGFEDTDHPFVAGKQTGTPRAVAGLTEKSAPGTWIMRVRRPSTGM